MSTAERRRRVEDVAADGSDDGVEGGAADGLLHWKMLGGKAFLRAWTMVGQKACPSDSWTAPPTAGRNDAMTDLGLGRWLGGRLFW